MSKLQRKLRSRTGASMILALMFLMFCSFVGSSVLVSATANASRIGQYKNQQDFLNQRSAVLLLSDELQLEDGQQMRLYIIDAEKSHQEKIPNGATQGQAGAYDDYGNPAVERVITFQLVTNVEQLSAMQRLMLETTVWRYLREEVPKKNLRTSVVIRNFGKDSQGHNLDLNDFWFSYNAGVNPDDVRINADADTSVRGTFQVSGTLSADVQDITSFPEYEAFFSCGRGTNMLDFYVDFGEDSQLRLTMDAYRGTTQIPAVVGDVKSGRIPADIRPNNPDFPVLSNSYVQVTTTVTQSMISWSEPTIEKGSAVSIDRGVTEGVVTGGAEE